VEEAEGGSQEDSVGIANMHSASPISILKNIYSELNDPQNSVQLSLQGILRQRSTNNSKEAGDCKCCENLLHSPN
jgi:hypothetical protein